MPEQSDRDADVDGDGVVGILDLLAVLAARGETDLVLDLDGSGTVDLGDLLAILAGWTA